MKKTKTWKWLFLIVVMLAGMWQLNNAVADHYPPEHEINGVEGIKQPDAVTCGPTSVAMVLKRYGYDVGPMAVAKVAKTHLFKSENIEISGTLPKYVQISLEHFGVPCQVERESNMHNLRRYVSKDRPVVVLVRSSNLTWHYVVVVGYDKDSIIIYDPWDGKRHVMSNKVFEGSWNFTMDMEGNDTTQPCPICGGDGVLWDDFSWLGPFVKCDVCGGNGKRPDWLWLLMEMGEAKGYTLIVPDLSFES